jgi:hypothetical protein
VYGTVGQPGQQGPSAPREYADQRVWRYEDDAESSDSGYEMQNDTSDSDYMPSEDSLTMQTMQELRSTNEDMEPDDANEAGPGGQQCKI